MIFTIVLYILFPSFNNILVITLLHGIYIEFHSGGFVILISFSFIINGRNYFGRKSF